MTTTRPNLERLGDRIESATAGAVRRRARRIRAAWTGVALVLGLAGLAAVVLPGATGDGGVEQLAVGSGSGTEPATSTAPPPSTAPVGPPSPEEQVAQGMVDGSVAFTGTDPSCTTADDVTFTCTLAQLPTAQSTPDHTGVLYHHVDAERLVAGACQGQDVEGRTWTCLVGQAAVDAGWLGADLLGQHLPTPGMG